MEFSKNEVDIVPCYDVTEPTSIKSSVDRSPHHNIYIQQKISGLEGEIRLLKQFLRAQGLYGSESKVGGYSGYLCEVLILHYTSFIKCVKEMSKWRRGVIIDIEGHGDKNYLKSVYPSDPLIVVDPVDPQRNVASALTLDNFARSIHFARRFIQSPSIDYFIEKTHTPTIRKGRGTYPIAIEFTKPDISDDIIYPQIFKAMNSLENLIISEGFRCFST